MTILAGTDSVRPAILRRCKNEEFLYATDLPMAAEQKDVMLFVRKAENIGWRSEIQAGWILLDRIPAEPPENGFSGPYGPESKCCASILRRHSGQHKRDGTREKRMLIKAGEDNPDIYERTCAILHREWAEALRQGVDLPGLPVTFFGEEEEQNQ